MMDNKIKEIRDNADDMRYKNANGAKDKDLDAFYRGQIHVCDIILALLPQGDAEGLLTLDDMAKICERMGTLFKHPTYYKYEVVREILRAQKALCDQQREEAVRADRQRILDRLEENTFYSKNSDDVEISFNHEGWERFKVEYLGQSLKQEGVNDG